MNAKQALLAASGAFHEGIEWERNANRMQTECKARTAEPAGPANDPFDLRV